MSTTPHTHNADAAAGKVCSHLVTDEQFVAWGLQIARWGKAVGTPVLEREGVSGREAMMTAWERGLVRLCCPPSNFEPRPVHVPSAEFVADALAWVAAHTTTSTTAARAA